MGYALFVWQFYCLVLAALALQLYCDSVRLEQQWYAALIRR